MIKKLDIEYNAHISICFFSIFESLTCALRAQVNISHFLSVNFLTIVSPGMLHLL